MVREPTKAQLTRKVELLRREITNLRAGEIRHRETQESLQAIERQLAGIVHSAMDAIVTMDEAGRIVLFNEAAEKMFGCSPSDPIGQSIDRFIPKRFREAHREHVRAFGETDATNRRMGALGMIFGVRANGEEFPIEASISKVESDGKKRFTVILRDISERNRLEFQLRQTERLAEMGTLASGMAHEIGTPMNVILGRAEYLMRKSSEETTKNGLATIVSQVERITKIMNQLLSFARQRPVERRPLDWAVVVREILEVVKGQMEKRGIRLETTLESGVQKIFADGDQMRQVLLNLFLNAVQAMPNGGTLRVSLEQEGSQVKLSVTDTGCGILKENLPKLFTPFFTTKEVGEGTGLGLTVTHGIIQEHDGTIFVHSELGKGATFTLVLPADDPSQKGG